MPVDKSANRVRRMFGEIAGRYDFLNHLLSLNVDRYWRWRTVRKTPLAGDGPVLDVCCGTGDLTLAYARAAGRGPPPPGPPPEGGGGLGNSCGRLGAPVIGADFCPVVVVRAAEKTRAGAGRVVGVGGRAGGVARGWARAAGRGPFTPALSPEGRGRLESAGGSLGAPVIGAGVWHGMLGRAARVTSRRTASVSLTFRS